jgi:hypothetical protein
MLFVIGLATSCSTPIHVVSPIVEVNETFTLDEVQTPKTARPTTLQVTKTPTLRKILSSETPTASSVTQETDVSFDWNMKVGYVVYQNVNDDWLSQLWLVEPPFQSAELLFSTDQNSFITDYHLIWAHDGSRVAYQHLFKDDSEAISVFDTSTMESKVLYTTLQEPYDAGYGATFRLWAAGWSIDDRWIYFIKEYSISSEYDPHFQAIIVDTTNGNIVELDENIEFVAWSPTVPDQFLYIRHNDFPNYGSETIHVVRVGETEPILTFSDLGQYAPISRYQISWSPDGSRAIAFSPDWGVISLDFKEVKWSLLSLGAERLSVLSLWSLDGRWLLLYWGNTPYFWAVDETSGPTIPLVSKTEHLYPIVWTPDGSMFIYQDGYELYAINPDRPEATEFILDSCQLGIECINLSGLSISPQIWIQPKP